MTPQSVTPIGDYGIVGNLETCALVGPDGSIDWFPYPHVESASIFAAILDRDEGGLFRIGTREPCINGHRYIPRTNVLKTTFRTPNGTATVTDFMPPAGKVDHPKKVLFRKVSCSEGTVDIDVEFAPRFDYGRADPAFEWVDKGLLAAGPEEQTILESPVPLDVSDGRATGEISMEAGETEWVILRCTGAEDAAADPEAALDATVSYWRRWAKTCNRQGADSLFRGPWHDLAVRSALVLKLLTHENTGAVVAAPTTSLPEDIGGVRNWDYRFNWIRDAAFAVQALANLGHTEEVASYLDWLLDRCRNDGLPTIQPLYGLHGDTDLTERELDHLDGYLSSQPVRVGNGAADQLQLDSYGELLLAVDEALLHGTELSPDDWAVVRDIVETVREIWTEPDAGIWEMRGGNRHFVYSKVMCWLALDRGIAIATEYGLDAPLTAWRDEREAIRAEVLERGYDEDIGSFVQAYGSDALDATALLIPAVGFLPFGDERVQGTIAAVRDRLAIDEALVRRYDGDDGLPGREGAFALCSCWLVDALALSGHVEEANERFHSLTSYVSPLGLMAEEVDPETGEQLGNFPQAFSHLGFVNSFLYLGSADGYDTASPPMGIRLGDPVLPDDS